MRIQRIIVAGDGQTFARVSRALIHWVPRFMKVELSSYGPGNAKDHARRWARSARIDMIPGTTPSEGDIVLWFGGQGDAMTYARRTGARVVEVC